MEAWKVVKMAWRLLIGVEMGWSVVVGVDVDRTESESVKTQARTRS